jgi:D-sedoheptulose 7-phosphate isomerase
MTTAADIQHRLDGTLDVITWLRSQAAAIESIGRLLAQTLQSGGLVMTAGNGGSAAEALHFSEELIGRYRSDRPAKRSICLNADSTALTCIGNDYGFEQVFARGVEGLGRPHDLVVGLSTSGRSPNIIRMFETSRRIGCRTLGLLGSDGGPCLSLCDFSIVVPSTDSAHVQEAHLAAIHLLCEFLEP